MFVLTGLCNESNVPSVSSINRILRNRAAERAACEYARIASQVLRPLYTWWPAPSPMPPAAHIPTSPLVTPASRSMSQVMTASSVPSHHSLTVDPLRQMANPWPRSVDLTWSSLDDSRDNDDNSENGNNLYLFVLNSFTSNVWSINYCIA